MPQNLPFLSIRDKGKFCRDDGESLRMLDYSRLKIIGNVEGLQALHEAIGKAIKTGESTCREYDSIGEPMKVTVLAGNLPEGIEISRREHREKRKTKRSV